MERQSREVRKTRADKARRVMGSNQYIVFQILYPPEESYNKSREIKQKQATGLRLPGKMKI